MNPLLRSGAAHVFVESIDHPIPCGDDGHHLFRVLRLREGETVTVSDGRGCWRATTVADGRLCPSGEVFAADQAVRCVVAAAIPKGDRLEWMVQKLTEVGATRIMLLDTARGVVRWNGDRGLRQLERLQRVVRDAASQSRRCWLPVLEGPLPVQAVLAVPGALLADPAGDPLPDVLGERGGVCGPIIVGPEGGFDSAELSAADLCGVRRTSLGGGVLRVETAAVIAAALVGVLGRLDNAE